MANKSNGPSKKGDPIPWGAEESAPAPLPWGDTRKLPAAGSGSGATCLVEEDLAAGDGDVEEEVEVGHRAVLPRRRRRRLPAVPVHDLWDGWLRRARRAGKGFVICWGSPPLSKE
jgi:hypothetical protein